MLSFTPKFLLRNHDSLSCHDLIQLRIWKSWVNKKKGGWFLSETFLWFIRWKATVHHSRVHTIGCAHGMSPRPTFPRLLEIEEGSGSMTGYPGNPRENLSPPNLRTHFVSKRFLYWTYSSSRMRGRRTMVVFLSPMHGRCHHADISSTISLRIPWNTILYPPWWKNIISLFFTSSCSVLFICYYVLLFAVGLHFVIPFFPRWLFAWVVATF